MSSGLNCGKNSRHVCSIFPFRPIYSACPIKHGLFETIRGGRGEGRLFSRRGVAASVENPPGDMEGTIVWAAVPVIEQIDREGRGQLSINVTVFLEALRQRTSTGLKQNGPSPYANAWRRHSGDAPAEGRK